MDPSAPEMPPFREMLQRSFASRSRDETVALGRALGSLLEGGETIALAGALGSGKTTFVKGLCEGLGLSDSRVVTSPTYVLEQVYEARVPVHHYDLYRLPSADEFIALGFEELLGGSSILVIEWADRALGVLPPDRLLVEIRGPEGDEASPERRIDLSGRAAAWERKLEGMGGR